MARFNHLDGAERETSDEERRTTDMPCAKSLQDYGCSWPGIPRLRSTVTSFVSEEEWRESVLGTVSGCALSKCKIGLKNCR